MALDVRGFWQRGRIVDGFMLPGSALRLAIGFVAMLIVVDSLIAAAFRGQPGVERVRLDSAGDVRAVLERAAADRQPFLLIGDSVLVGDVMEGHVERWQEQRVIDHLRREQAPESAATFHQVALDGLLPVDILRIVTELDRVDPSGRVPLVIELNPRYMSRHHAMSRSCTRTWVCDLGVPLLTESGVDVLAWVGITWEASLRLARRWLPILRHRSRLDLDFDLSMVPGIADREVEVASPDRLQARVRMLEHYARPRLGNKSVQVSALREVVRRINALGRDAVFFTTPVEDGFLDEATEGRGSGRLSSRWAELIGFSGTAQMVELDHPLFGAPLFLDHCHMRAEGNRLLALNLLHELNLGLSHVPPPTSIVRPEAADATLVSRVELGNSQGAAWQAAFNKPWGVAVEPGGNRVVIADSGNHCLREMRGNLQTVRTIAGRCDHRGSVDGPAKDARLSGPRTPALHGSSVYFTTRRGRDLRRLAQGQVSTAYTLAGPTWDRIKKIVSVDAGLYLQDGGRRILRFDPATRRTTRILVAEPEAEIRTFTVASDGSLYVADHQNRIWRVEASAQATLRSHGEIVFANTAETTLPEEVKSFFPFPLEEVKLHRVLDLQWVERYGGLLVQDDILPGRRSKRGTYVTERVALRFVSFDDGLVYPWLKPLAFGGGHILYNRDTKSLVSRIHLGSMALDPVTGSLLYLEKHRSRLFRMGDGLWGTGRIGNVASPRVFNMAREFLGTEAGDATLARFAPYRFLDERRERLPRQGPYVGLMVGSSMIGASDSVGMYSIGRRIEQELGAALGYRDRTRFELIVRSYPGASFRRELRGVENLVEQHGVPDVIIFGLRATGRFFGKKPDRQATLRRLGRLRDAAKRVDALLLFVDTTPLVSRKREGLRSGTEEGEEMIDMIRRAGFVVIDPRDRMLEDHLEVSPWGSPPFAKHHVSPWAVDAAAKRYAAELYPHVRAHVEGRVPAWRVPLGAATPSDAPLGPALATLREVKVELPKVAAEAVRRQRVEQTIEIFVDLARVSGKKAKARPSPSDYERIAIAAIRKVAKRDPATALASVLTIRLAEFSSYDEYGQGALDGAEVRFERSFDADGLEAFVVAVAEPGR